MYRLGAYFFYIYTYNIIAFKISRCIKTAVSIKSTLLTIFKKPILSIFFTWSNFAIPQQSSAVALLGFKTISANALSLLLVRFKTYWLIFPCQLHIIFNSCRYMVIVIKNVYFGLSKCPCLK